MPKVKQLAAEPWRAEIRAEIGAGMAAMRINQNELAKLTGIPPTTLSKRLGKNGNIGAMRLEEYEAIKKVFRRGGVLT